MQIKNIARLTDSQLMDALAKHGHPTPHGVSRPQLIKLARNVNAWNYKGNVVPEAWKAAHPDGRCGDEVCEALQAAIRSQGKLQLSALEEIWTANGIDHVRWAHCNIGQQVMNTSNVLRNRAKKGEPVFIGGQSWNTGSLPVETTSPEPEAEKFGPPTADDVYWIPLPPRAELRKGKKTTA